MMEIGGEIPASPEDMGLTPEGPDVGGQGEEKSEFQGAFGEALRENTNKIFESEMESIASARDTLEPIAGGWSRAHQVGTAKAFIDRENKLANDPTLEYRLPETISLEELKKCYSPAGEGVWDTSTQEHFFARVLAEKGREHSQEQQSLNQDEKSYKEAMGGQVENPLDVAEQAYQAISDAFDSGRVSLSPVWEQAFSLYNAWKAGKFETTQSAHDRLKEKFGPA